ncbi:hypothetical protein AX15_002717 [Amanita polypyramis BW_CC]|nr:hypothetical protein AX15_002717 [Amanita polypyramis BW_CC]
MFKRVEKRLKKREQVERLGIDDETRDILGLNDIDSSESDSGSELSGSDVNVFQDDVESSDDEDERGSDEEDETPSHFAFQIFTAQQALEEPIYAHPTQRNAHLCAICPGKTLVSLQSIVQHQASKAHVRRSNNITKLAALPENADGSLTDLLQQLYGGPRPGSQPQEGGGTSKRAEKKQKAAARRKVEREKRKGREKEKQKEEEQEVRDDKNVSEPIKAGVSSALAAPPAKRDKKKKNKAKAEPSQPEQTKQVQASKKDTGKATPSATAKPKESADDKKRKKGAEKEKEVTIPSTQPPPKKKRKTGETSITPSEEEELKKQIKAIVKSATVHARKAMLKAKQDDGDDKHKSKEKKKMG